MMKRLSFMLTVAIAAAACTVHQTEAPALTGPSTFASAPPPDAPVARFNISPDKPIVGQVVLFDGTSSCPGPELDDKNCRPSANTISRFVWDFGDGSTGSGPTANHRYVTPRFYAVTLTVTNDRGATTQITKPVELGESAPPTASFSFLPATPAPGDGVVFTATSAPVAGRTNVYSWEFGDPSSPDNVAIGNSVSHPFANAGSYVVTLIVEDDLNRTAVAKQTVTVKVKTQGASISQGVTVTAAFKR